MINNESQYLDKVIKEIKTEATNRDRGFFIDKDINNINDLGINQYKRLFK